MECFDCGECCESSGLSEACKSDDAGIGRVVLSVVNVASCQCREL